MIGPINYSAQMVDPFQGLGQFVGIGQQIRESRQQEAKQNQAQQAAEQYRADITAAMSNPSPRAFASLALKYPGQREAFKQGWEAISAEQQQNELRDAGRLAAALSSGRADVAERLIAERITAAKNSGVPAPELEMLMDSIKANPRQAYGQVLHLVSALPGGDKVLESLGKVGTERRAQELQPDIVKKGAAEASAAESAATTAAVTAKFAERVAQAGLDEKSWQVRNLRSQIDDRASRLKLDRDRLANETLQVLSTLEKNATDIGDAGKKLVNESATAAGVAKLTASKANDLSQRITQIGSSWGAGSSFAEWLKKSTGEQGAVTQLRNEYARLRNTEALRNLPPGPATDRDIEVALQGIPPETADPATIQKFLRGMAKMADIDAAVNTAKADYLYANRGTLSRAARAFEAGGVSVPKGEDWTTVAARVAKKAASEYEPRPSAVDQIPTSPPRSPIPSAESSVRARADAILAGSK